MGIGLASAKRFASLGAHVVVFARGSDGLERAVVEVAAVRRSPDQRIAWRQVDVSDAPQVAAVVQATIAELGVPDVLLNCAGRARPGYVQDIDATQLEATLRVNLFGCWNTVQALLPHMRPRGGYIVNTASLAGLIGVFGYADYCASKFAVIGFSEVLRAELVDDGITVSVLCPPDVDTPGFAEENRHKPPETMAASAGASLLSAEAVADALVAGMARRRFLIIPGRQARISHLVRRVAPGLVTWVMDRQVRAARRSG
jgi:NAD(P)-dependent dehydrogenase (short-subunit alcohol dehydrogenase family)